jgi:hypothetical protein
MTRHASPGAAQAVDVSCVDELRLDRSHYETIVEHGRRKLQGPYLEDETPERHAFGLLAGRIEGAAIQTTHVFPMRRNMRHEAGFRRAMDETVFELGVPSKTPLARRGWLADPSELFEINARCERERAIVYASYHMHKVSWAHDPLRDTPTVLDTALAEGQGIWMMILSLVDPGRPLLRAFFEGRKDREGPIVVAEAAQA